MKKLIYLFVMVAGLTLATTNVDAQDAKVKEKPATACTKSGNKAACCKSGDKTAAAKCCKKDAAACTKKDAVKK